MHVPRPFNNPTAGGFELRSREASQGNVEAGEQEDPDYKGDAGVGTYHSVHLPTTSSMGGIRVEVAKNIEYR